MTTANRRAPDRQRQRDDHVGRTGGGSSPPRGALFVDKGYGRTTVADIAEAAGVATETVYAAFRNKPTFLHRAWDVAVGGDEQDVHLLDRPEMRAVLTEPDLVTRLTRFVEVNTAVMRRTAPLLGALRGAAASEPASAALVAKGDGARLQAMRVHAVAAGGSRRLAVCEEECRDVLWSRTDGTLWHRLVVERGWTDDRYATWLGRFAPRCWSRTTTELWGSHRSVGGTHVTRWPTCRRARGRRHRRPSHRAVLTALRLDADRLPRPRIDGDREALRILLAAPPGTHHHQHRTDQPATGAAPRGRGHQ